MTGRLAGELQADGVVAALAGFVEQQAVAAADVEQAPARAVGADEVEQAVRGRAPALLLRQVLVVAHVAVELVQRVALREHGLLDRPALAALEQVAVLARDVRGRREMGSRKGRTVSPHSELEFPRADPAHRHAMRHATSERPEWDAAGYERASRAL